MINFKNISFNYRATSLFENLDWEIKSPRITNNHIHCVLGPSGFGKTTLFKLILGIEKVDKGEVEVDINKISYVPQEPILFDHLSIEENATFYKRIKAKKNQFDQSIFDRYKEVLDIADLLESKNKISELSGGQKRRISLLKALSLNPDILLLDEPTTGLDTSVKLDFLDAIKKIAKELDILVLYVTHHLEEAQVIADKVHYLTRNNEGIIDTIYSDSYSNFIQNPPNKDAAIMVSYPERIKYLK
jgi:ABC-2 type transport system ATP-binding protein